MSIEQNTIVSIDHYRNEIIQLLQKPVSIPSNAGDEGALARFLLEASKKIRLLCTVVLPLGDVNGVLGSGKSDGYFLLNTHLDEAEPGDVPEPYSGAILDGSQFGGIDDPKDVRCMRWRIRLRQPRT